jgi:hypothetical protein
MLRLTEFVLIAGGILAAVAAGIRGHGRPALVATVLAVSVYIFFLGRIRRAHFGGDATVLSLLGLPVFSYLLLRSRLSHKQGSVRWKGRTYGSSTNSAGADALAIKTRRPAERRSA